MKFSLEDKTIIMKHSRSNDTRQNKSEPGHRPQPQNKDDLDSRKNEEQDNKGDDVTHNRKEVRSDNNMRKGRNKD